MFEQRGCHFLHRLDLRLVCSNAPVAQKLRCPGWRCVRPESMEVFSLQVRPHAFQIVLCFLRSDFVQCFTKFFGDVETIENVERCGGSFPQHFQIRWQHIRACELNTLDDRFVQDPKESLQARFGAILCNIEQSFDSGVQLVHQRQVLMATSVLDLINADRFDSTKVTMNDPVANDPMNCTVNTIPTGAKDCRDFLPTYTFGPSRKEDAIRLGLRVLAASPRHSFRDNSTGRTVHSPQCVNKEDRYRPEWNKLKPTFFQAIVTSTFLSADRADGLGTLTRQKDKFNFAFFVSVPRNVQSPFAFQRD